MINRCGYDRHIGNDVTPIAESGAGCVDRIVTDLDQVNQAHITAGQHQLLDQMLGNFRIVREVGQQALKRFLKGFGVGGGFGIEAGPELIDLAETRLGVYLGCLSWARA